MPFVNEREKKRVVDYERNAVMTLGGVKHITSTPRTPQIGFVIKWEGHEIEVIAYYNTEVFKDDGSSGRKTYVISKCYYEPALRPFRDEIIDMVTEALKTYGVNFGSREGTEIVVKIDPGIGALNLDYKFDDQPETHTALSEKNKK